MLPICGAYFTGASQPAMSSDIRGASQPAADIQLPYCDAKVVSFNFGMHSLARKSDKERDDDAAQLSVVLDDINQAEQPNVIFGCEVGGLQQGSFEPDCEPDCDF